jgi:RNA recognition motif-containing protein
MKIYVGNMSFTTTENSLREKFEEFGTVEEAVVITDRETGRPRGFGFVTMPNNDEGKSAIDSMNEADFEGRTLKVNEARPRRDDNRGGGGGSRW